MKIGEAVLKTTLGDDPCKHSEDIRNKVLSILQSKGLASEKGTWERLSVGVYRLKCASETYVVSYSRRQDSARFTRFIFTISEEAQALSESSKEAAS